MKSNKKQINRWYNRKKDHLLAKLLFLNMGVSIGPEFDFFWHIIYILPVTVVKYISGNDIEM